MRLFRRLLFLGLVLPFPLLAAEPKPLTAEAIAERSQTAHKLRSWGMKDLVRAEVKIVYGGETMVDGTFTFQAHGPKTPSKMPGEDFRLSEPGMAEVRAKPCYTILQTFGGSVGGTPDDCYRSFAVPENSRELAQPQ